MSASVGGVVLAGWEGRPVERWRLEWGLPAFHAYSSTGSTNDAARALAEAGAPAGAVVLADRQTAGRGRSGRRWHAPAGAGLLFSMVLRPREGGAAGVAPLPLLVGLLVAEGIEAATGLEAMVKWPNDLFSGGRKLGGVLCESSWADDACRFVIVGVGVNVLHDAGDFPPELRPGATSLRLEGVRADRPAVLGAVLERLLPLAVRPLAPLAPREMELLRRRDLLLGERVGLDDGAVGEADGVEPDGALRVRATGGALRLVRSGGVRRLDPAMEEAR